MKKMAVGCHMKRTRLCQWLREKINSGGVIGLEWVDRKRGLFKIPWKHSGKHDWTPEQSLIFKEWAIHTGKYKEGENPKYARWKTNLRCALYKAEDIQEQKTLLPDRDTHRFPFKMYRFIKKKKNSVPINLEDCNQVTNDNAEGNIPTFIKLYESGSNNSSQSSGFGNSEGLSINNNMEVENTTATFQSWNGNHLHLQTGPTYQTYSANLTPMTLTSQQMGHSDQPVTASSFQPKNISFAEQIFKPFADQNIPPVSPSFLTPTLPHLMPIPFQKQHHDNQNKVQQSCAFQHVQQPVDGQFQKFAHNGSELDRYEPQITKVAYTCSTNKLHTTQRNNFTRPVEFPNCVQMNNLPKPSCNYNVNPGYGTSNSISPNGVNNVKMARGLQMTSNGSSDTKHRQMEYERSKQANEFSPSSKPSILKNALLLGVQSVQTPFNKGLVSSITTGYTKLGNNKSMKIPDENNPVKQSRNAFGLPMDSLSRPDVKPQPSASFIRSTTSSARSLTSSTKEGNLPFTDLANIQGFNCRLENSQNKQSVGGSARYRSPVVFNESSNGSESVKSPESIDGFSSSEHEFGKLPSKMDLTEHHCQCERGLNIEVIYKQRLQCSQHVTNQKGCRLIYKTIPEDASREVAYPVFGYEFEETDTLDMPGWPEKLGNEDVSSKASQILENLQRGIIIQVDNTGDIYVTRMCTTSVYCSNPVSDEKYKLNRDDLQTKIKVFDFQKFESDFEKFRRTKETIEPSPSFHLYFGQRTPADKTLVLAKITSCKALAELNNESQNHASNSSIHISNQDEYDKLGECMKRMSVGKYMYNRHE